MKDDPDCPPGEYDTYALQLWGKLQHDVPVEELARWLDHVATDWMGVGSDRSRAVAERAVAIARSGSPWREVPRPARAQVMGVVNVTPDSFSDGGRFFDPAAAIAHALRLIEQGADILDIGGESTRPGADPVSEAEEIARVLPVIKTVRREHATPISIDTMKPAVARAAVAAGAHVWNDVTALGWSPGSLRVAADLQCGVVLMHMQGEPRTMQQNPTYDDVVEEVRDFLAERAQAALSAGVPHGAIVLDPGIGFGKTLAHNLTLLANLDRLTVLGFPVLVGASRKRMIQAIDAAATDPFDRLGGSLALHLHAAANGAAIIRTHDVRETVQALQVQAALRNATSRP